MVNPLDPLLAEGVIDEVLGRLKSGKEADIYLVRHGGGEVAAKVYKNRAHRSFKNNADYKEGRAVRNSRTQRAIEGRSRFGQQAAEQAWKTAESDALSTLHASGVRVPRPIIFHDGVLLMQLVTDGEGRPAPRWIDVAFPPGSGMALYRDLRQQIIRMLCCEIIHGDLSPYNILAAAEGSTIIDFPQMVSPSHNSRAEFFFLRDFQNVLHFLAGLDRSLLAYEEDGQKIWRAYVRRELTPDFVPSPPQVRLNRPPHQHRPGQQRPNPNPNQPHRQGPPRNGSQGQNPPRQGPPGQNRQGQPNHHRQGQPNHPRPPGQNQPRPPGQNQPRPPGQNPSRPSAPRPFPPRPPRHDARPPRHDAPNHDGRPRSPGKRRRRRRYF